MSESTNYSYIVITYMCRKNCRIIMDIFKNENDVKEWLFMQLKQDDELTNWYNSDEDVYYYGFEDIYKNIKHIPLKELIDGLIDYIEILIKYIQ